MPGYFAEQKKRGEKIIGRVQAIRQWATRAVHEFYLLEQAVQATYWLCDCTIAFALCRTG